MDSIRTALFHVAEMLTATSERLWLMSLQGCAFILVVLIARQLLKNYPKVYSYCLWALVGIRLLCPLLLESSWSLQPDYEQFSFIFHSEAQETKQTWKNEPTADANAEPANTSQADAFGKTNHMSEQDILLENPALGENGQSAEETLNKTNMDVNTEAESNIGTKGEESTKTWKIPFHTLLVFVYVSGVILLAGSYLIRYFLMYKRLSTATRKDANIWLCDNAPSAFVIGVLHPRIILPYGLSEKEEAYIVQHELVHIRHFDPAVRMLGILCLCLHWWNPLVWLAVLKMNQDMEMFCDETVLQTAPFTERKAYAGLLLTFAVHNSGFSMEPSFGESNAEQRIRNILSQKKKNKGLLCAVLAVVLLCGAVLFIMPEQDEETTIPEENPLLTREPEVTAKNTAHIFAKNDVLATNPVPAYTLAQLQQLGTVRTVQGILPGAAYGTWYIAAYQGVVYYFGCLEEKEETQAKLYSYAIFSEDYPLANGIQVGMTKEEILALYPDMAEILITKETAYPENESFSLTFVSDCYPRSYSDEDATLNYQDSTVWFWHDQFDSCLLAEIDGETHSGRAMALALMLKNNQVSAITFYCTNDGMVTPEDWAAAISDPWNGMENQTTNALEFPQLQEETAETLAALKQYQTLLYEYLPVLYDSFAICDFDLDGNPELLFHISGPSDEMPEGYFKGIRIMEYSPKTELWTEALSTSSSANLTFFDNGVAASAQTHNHSYACLYGRELWPYTLYQYNVETNTYDLLAEVCAWDKYCHAAEFPEAADADGDGLVYCFTSDGIWQDGAAYEAWLKETFDGTRAYRIPYQSLSPEAIEAIVH